MSGGLRMWAEAGVVSVDTAGLALAYLSPACDSDRKHGGCQVANRHDTGCNYGEGVWKVDTEQKAEIGK